MNMLNKAVMNMTPARTPPGCLPKGRMKGPRPFASMPLSHALGQDESAQKQKDGGCPATRRYRCRQSALPTGLRHRPPGFARDDQHAGGKQGHRFGYPQNQGHDEDGSHAARGFIHRRGQREIGGRSRRQRGHNKRIVEPDGTGRGFTGRQLIEGCPCHCYFLAWMRRDAPGQAFHSPGSRRGAGSGRRRSSAAGPHSNPFY